ncbi:hypothetical protein [Massilia aquatica]|uniref:Uncharacterized protein n=1 Tax=Massilia aquatica TaxID=2609000 RepID=A0ABX0MQK6_9BURK|nr:hypothetical protein [Massilia aquatica]NHZ44496.1 hypothetical protein [Massilia aquatica]
MDLGLAQLRFAEVEHRAHVLMTSFCAPDSSAFMPSVCWPIFTLVARAGVRYFSGMSALRRYVCPSRSAASIAAYDVRPAGISAALMSSLSNG